MEFFGPRCNINMLGFIFSLTHCCSAVIDTAETLTTLGNSIDFTPQIVLHAEFQSGLWAWAGFGQPLSLPARVVHTLMDMTNLDYHPDEPPHTHECGGLGLR